LKQGLQTTVREAISSGREAVFSMKKKYNYEKFVDSVQYNTSQNNHIA